MNILARYRYPLALILAGLCAVGAVFLTKYYFDAKERELREKIRLESQLTDIVVAKRNLKIGDKVSLDNMMIKSVPFEFVPDGAIKPEDYASIENKNLSDPMSAGKPLLRHFVEGAKRIERFSDLLGNGERAVTLEVDGVSSIEHMIEAGDFIDLGVRKNKSLEFELLLEKIRVLSTGNFTVSDPKVTGLYKKAQYSTLTLGVDSRYVQDIFEAESNGSLVYLLRNREDEQASAYELASAEDNVLLYANEADESGALKGVKEKIKRFDMGDASHNAIRNEKGRLVRLVQETRNSDSGVDLNEFASNK